ncbi:MAG: c-type cytochrome biogenesis protein CcmI [Rhodospirillales bacterium]|nr:c-type cytochrome biogenesis protein CcmI [Rhodospirillales bacterium]
MSLIWIWIAVIIAVALALLTLPVIRSRKTARAARESYDVAIYKDQLKEAEREFERGLLSPEQAAAVKTELHRKLLAAAGPADKSDRAAVDKTGPKWATVTGLVVFLVGGSLALYSHLGTPMLDNLAYVDRDIEKEQQAQGNQRSGEEMSALLDRLESKLAGDPENLEGWIMLGRSSVSLGQFPRAVRAYEQAVRRAPEDPQLLVDYGEAVSFMNEGRVTDDALAALEKAHGINAANPKARYYMALAAAQAGDLPGAIQQWIDLLAISLPDAPWVTTVRTQVANAADEAGIDPMTVVPSAKAMRIGADIQDSARARAELPGPRQEDVEAASAMSPEERQQMIRSMVERLAQRLKENPNDRPGWLRLANAYKVLGETEKSNAAMEQAARLAE